MSNKIAGIVILILGVLFAIILGVDVGTADYERLSTYFVVASVVYFFIHGWRNVWWLTALLVFSGAMFIHGFKFEGEHLFVMMIMLASIMSLISGGTIPQAPEIRLAGSRSALLITGTLVLYGFVHFLVYYVLPYDPAQYSVKNSAKAYFECYASMFCFFWLLGGYYGFILRPKWDVKFLVIIGICLMTNVITRASMFAQGFQSEMQSSLEGRDMYSWHVPVINMFAGVYTLRNISPIISVICFMLITSRGWWTGQKRWVKALVVGLIVFSLIGAVLSGGRATLLFCIALGGLVALKRRKVGVIAVSAGAGVILVALINIFADTINTKAPNFVARSFQFLMFEKGSTYYDISGSQEARLMAHDQAYIEWRRDDRTLLFGRSVLAMSDDEAQYNRDALGLDGFVMNAMQLGRTHGLITDLLLQYGIAGFSLYMASYLAVIRYVWKLAKVVPEELFASKALIGAASIYLPMIFVYQLAGGTFMPLVIPLIVGLVRADLVAKMRSAHKVSVETAEERNPILGRIPARS